VRWSELPLGLLRRKHTALLLFRTPGKPRPVRKKTWAAAPAPENPARRNALRAKEPLRRHSAGALVWPPKAALLGHIYPIPSPTPRGGSLVGHGGQRGAVWGLPNPKQNLRPLGPPIETSARARAAPCPPHNRLQGAAPPVPVPSRAAVQSSGSTDKRANGHGAWGQRGNGPTDNAPVGRGENIIFRLVGDF
jgi:hypothetical protein